MADDGRGQKDARKGEAILGEGAGLVGEHHVHIREGFLRLEGFDGDLWFWGWVGLGAC